MAARERITMTKNIGLGLAGLMALGGLANADDVTGVDRMLCAAGQVQICIENDTCYSAAAVELWREHLPGSVIAIGNAPTALFRLLGLLAGDAPRPAAILAFPVGFIGAAESKQALIDAELDIPYITLLGRRGGSALAAAAVNALAGLKP